MAEVNKNGDLSPEGKTRQKKKLVLEALAEFEKSNTLATAQDAAQRQLDNWAEKSGLSIKTPIEFC
jgi:hypothetical protein